MRERPNYKVILEAAETDLGIGYSRKAYTRWRKNLSDERRKAFGLPARGALPEKTQQRISQSRIQKKNEKASGFERMVPTFGDSRLFLYSRRGTRTPRTMCDECYLVGTVFRYAKSSLGRPAYVCVGCKAKIFNRSFDRVDAMAVAVQGGLPGSNKKKR